MLQSHSPRCGVRRRRSFLPSRDRRETHQIDVDAEFGQFHGCCQTGQPATDHHYPLLCHRKTFRQSLVVRPAGAARKPCDSLTSYSAPASIPRGSQSYAAYGELEFGVPLGTEGDCWDRYAVRMGELRWAASLIGQLLDGMPEGDFTAKVPKVLKPPAGETYAAVESPRGELGIHLVSDGSATPYRMRLRSPAYFNLAVIDEALSGGLLADAVATVGSLDIVLGEIDR